ncbi:MAG: DUF1127 domain-containing protein [Alphaproteobacteria bacterium]|nr:DUF1127 domain-containing protein [Alphaproteobacteria bacterium]
MDDAVPADAAQQERPLARLFASLRARVRVTPKRQPPRREVAGLSDHLLRDIGLEPRSAGHETTPSVWDQWRR